MPSSVNAPSSRRTQPLVAAPLARKRTKKRVKRNGKNLRLSSSSSSHVSSQQSSRQSSRASSGKSLRQHGIAKTTLLPLTVPHSAQTLKSTTSAWPAMQKANMQKTLAQLDGARNKPQADKPSETPKASVKPEKKPVQLLGDDDTIDFSFDEPPSAMNVLSMLVSNTAEELGMVGREIGNRLAYCFSSPTRIMSTVASVFLYSCSMLITASSLLGTFAVVLPVLGAATFPVWLGLLIAGGAVAFGIGLGVYNASNGRQILPEGTTHWFDLMFKMNYLRKLPLIPLVTS